MKLMLTKNGSGESRVVDVINVTDVPYCFWMWARYREKWKHDWHYDPTNRRGANLGCSLLITVTVLNLSNIWLLKVI